MRSAFIQHIFNVHSLSIFSDIPGNRFHQGVNSPTELYLIDRDFAGIIYCLSMYKARWPKNKSLKIQRQFCIFFSFIISSSRSMKKKSFPAYRERLYGFFLNFSRSSLIFTGRYFVPGQCLKYFYAIGIVRFAVLNLYSIRVRTARYIGTERPMFTNKKTNLT